VPWISVVEKRMTLVRPPAHENKSAFAIGERMELQKYHPFSKPVDNCVYGMQECSLETFGIIK
jgi:hypothetical protein